MIGETDPSALRAAAEAAAEAAVEEEGAVSEEGIHGGGDR